MFSIRVVIGKCLYCSLAPIVKLCSTDKVELTRHGTGVLMNGTAYLLPEGGNVASSDDRQGISGTHQGYDSILDPIKFVLTVIPVRI